MSVLEGTDVREHGGSALTGAFDDGHRRARCGLNGFTVRSYGRLRIGKFQPVTQMLTTRTSTAQGARPQDHFVGAPPVLVGASAKI